MNEDITLNPTSGASGMQEMQHEELTREKASPVDYQQQMHARAAQGVQCPYCGSVKFVTTISAKTFVPSAVPISRVRRLFVPSAEIPEAVLCARSVIHSTTFLSASSVVRL